MREAAAGVAHAIVAFHEGARPIVLLRVGARERLSSERIATIDEAFGVASSGIRYEDARSGCARVVVIESGRIVAAKLVGDIASERWLKDLALDGLESQSSVSR